MKQFVSQLDRIAKPVTKFSVNDNRIVLLHEGGLVSGLNRSSLEILYHFDSEMEPRAAFHLPPFGPVMTSFPEMKAFNERSGKLVDQSYYPRLEAIDSSFPINQHCIVCAVEWASSYGRPISSNKFSFVKPENMECFHSVDRPKSDQLHSPVIARDGSMFIKCSEKAKRHPSYGEPQEPFQFEDIKEQQWAMIDGVTLCYQDFYLSSKFSRILIGKQGSMFGMEKSDKLITLFDRLGTYTGDYFIPVSDSISFRDYYLNDRHLVLETNKKELIHIDLILKQSSLIPCQGDVKLCQEPALPYLLLFSESDQCLLYHLDKKEIIKGSIPKENYPSLIIPKEDFFIRVTRDEEKNQINHIVDGRLVTELFPDDFDEAWGFHDIGKGRILFCMQSKMYVLDCNQFMEHIYNGN